MTILKTHLDSCSHLVDTIALESGHTEVCVGRRDIILLRSTITAGQRLESRQMRETAIRNCRANAYAMSGEECDDMVVKPIVDPLYHSPLERLLHEKGLDISRPYIARERCGLYGDLVFYQN